MIFSCFPKERVNEVMKPSGRTLVVIYYIHLSYLWINCKYRASHRNKNAGKSLSVKRLREETGKGNTASSHLCSPQSACVSLSGLLSWFLLPSLLTGGFHTSLPWGKGQRRHQILGELPFSKTRPLPPRGWVAAVDQGILDSRNSGHRAARPLNLYPPTQIPIVEI